MIDFANSTTETFEPKRAYTEPNSRPITPPPMTIRCFGISFKLRASVEVIILFLSTGKNGNEVGFDPVAMMTFLAVICSVEPSAFVILMVFLSTNEPTPWKLSILFFLNKKVIPAVFCAMTSSLRAIIFAISTLRSFKLMPNASKLWAALW
ncbi:hypothetical protein D3C73_1194050 [compost metagenome]